MPSLLPAGRTSSLTSTPNIPASVLNLKSGPSPGISPNGIGTPELRAASSARLSTIFFASMEGVIR
jgi:hypothetical protein